MSDVAGLDPTAEVVQKLMSLSAEEFRGFISALNAGEVPTSQRQLGELMSAALPTGEDAEQLTAFSLAFSGTLYWGAYDPKSTLARISKNTASQLGVDVEEVSERLSSLLQARAVFLVAGAQMGRRKTAGLIERFGVQMDARPVVDPRGDGIDLYAIYHRVHLVVTDDEAGEEEKVIEVVFDHDDLQAFAAKITASLDAQRRVQAALASTGATVYLPVKGD